jgi:hypothetical protein
MPPTSVNAEGDHDVSGAYVLGMEQVCVHYHPPSPCVWEVRRVMV